MLCKHCGCENLEGSTRCVYCGEAIEAADASISGIMTAFAGVAVESETLAEDEQNDIQIVSSVSRMRRTDMNAETFSSRNEENLVISDARVLTSGNALRKEGFHFSSEEAAEEPSIAEQAAAIVDNAVEKIMNADEAENQTVLTEQEPPLEESGEETETPAEDDILNEAPARQYQTESPLDFSMGLTEEEAPADAPSAAADFVKTAAMSAPLITPHVPETPAIQEREIPVQSEEEIRALSESLWEEDKLGDLMAYAEAEEETAKEAEAETEAQTETEAEAETQPESYAEPETETKAENGTETGSESEPQPESEQDAAPAAVTENEVKAEAEADTQSETVTEKENEAEAEADPHPLTEEDFPPETPVYTAIPLPDKDDTKQTPGAPHGNDNEPPANGSDNNKKNLIPLALLLLAALLLIALLVGLLWPRSQKGPDSSTAPATQASSLPAQSTEKESTEASTPGESTGAAESTAETTNPSSSEAPSESSTENMESTENTETAPPETTVQEPNPFYYLSQAKAGEIIAFGSYPQEQAESSDIQWLVLAVEEDRTLLISRYCLDSIQYSTLTPAVWSTSYARSWLNDTFYNTAFSEDAQGQILESELDNPANPETGISGGEKTTDKVFILSGEEIARYMNSSQIKTIATKRSIENGAYLGADQEPYWWVRTPGHTADTCTHTRTGGLVDYSGEKVTVTTAVRPAVWISNQQEPTR